MKIAFPADDSQDSGRLRGLLVLAALMALALLGGVALNAVIEPGGTNSYALLAQSFLEGRFHSDTCFDGDCAVFDGRTYVMFPPFPALVAMPFVALFGVEFSGFVLLSALFTAAAAWLWWRILSHLEVEQATALWLVLALVFATPLYYVTLRGDGVWFFAQTLAFLLVTASIHQVVRGGSLVLAGVLIGLAFLCRQMSMFYLPFLFALALERDEPLISFARPHIARVLKLGLPVAVAVLAYMAYNYARFGGAMETGYQHMASGGEWSMIDFRLDQSGLFSLDYLFFNAMYLFIQGFHLDFGGDAVLTPLGLDPAGTSLLAASPFVLLALFAPMRRPVVIGILCAIAIAAPTLVYHSNGFSQYNVQRYVLDWLPILVYVLALAVARRHRPSFAVLATYGIGLNLVTMALLVLLNSA
ncbi:glycosyltransferase family 39 protein [Pelagibacterium montanilacus]|uniref:glycosyltransferase family 39 protein n=1 Tax=Pelagibacterium montanilacus TaxID=2185280 RepID=UPI0013DFF6AB|nr:glycosyltransferase family 39 protein [Pelagibacterium montanilacus]